jgi:hypothetical protein
MQLLSTIRLKFAPMPSELRRVASARAKVAVTLFASAFARALLTGLST